MSKLSLFWPVKPLVVSQAFGIFNLAYKQFGFTKHNGIDMPVKDGQIAYAMCDSYVADTGYNDGAGNFVRLETEEEVEAEGKKGRVGLMYMHAKKVLVQKGQTLLAGDPVMECDNTGFSTGHHLHVSAYFVNEKGKKLKQGDKETDYCFDWSKYWNKFYAEDAQKILSLFNQVINLLTSWLSKL